MRFKFLPPSAEHPFGTDNFGRSHMVARDLRRAALARHGPCGALPSTPCSARSSARSRAISAVSTIRDARQRRADGVSRDPARDRHHRRARALDAQRHHRARHRLYPAHRAHRARFGDRAARDGIRAGRDRRRRGALAHLAPPHPAERHGAADRAAELPLRLRGLVRGDAELPRPRRRAADADLGQHHGARAANT